MSPHSLLDLEAAEEEGEEGKTAMTMMLGCVVETQKWLASLAVILLAMESLVD